MPALATLILLVVFAGATIIIAAWALLTALLPRMNGWGATDAELARTLPGDELVPQPRIETTRAITINASPAEVWPWLAQIGYHRAGWYSYDFLHRLLRVAGSLDDPRASANRVIPELQDLKVGDSIKIAPQMAFEVMAIEPQRVIVLYGGVNTSTGEKLEPTKPMPDRYLSTSWVWLLEEVDSTSTRLLVSYRQDYNPSWLNRLLYRISGEFGAFLMERRTLLGIKQRVEAEARATVEKEESATLLEGLRIGQAQVQRETWENEPELMGLLEEALNLYWECFSRLDEHEMRDDVERSLVYLTAAAFHTLQSCFKLLELGHYRQAGLLIRLAMNEYLLCSKFRADPDAATTFLTGPDWTTVQALGGSILPELEALDGYPGRLASHLSTALQEGLSWTAYVAVGELALCREVSETTKDTLKTLQDELRKDRLPGMTALLKDLEGRVLPRDKVLEHRFDLELLHRHAHAAGAIVKAEVEARDAQGGQWINPRYDRDKCRYCGYRLGLWSTTVLGVLTDCFASLSTNKAWTERLDGFSEALLNWAREADLERRAAMS